MPSGEPFGVPAFEGMTINLGDASDLAISEHPIYAERGGHQVRGDSRGEYHRGYEVALDYDGYPAGRAQEGVVGVNLGELHDDDGRGYGYGEDYERV